MGGGGGGDRRERRVGNKEDEGGGRIKRGLVRRIREKGVRVWYILACGGMKGMNLRNLGHD